MKKLLLITLLAAAKITTAQTVGALDNTFNTTGIVQNDMGPLDLYQDVKIQADGKIVAVGTSYDATYAASIVVTRMLEDGNYDNSFGTNGIFTYTLNYETGAYECLVKSNGKILVVGYTTDNGGNGTAMLLLQLNANGTLDNTFANGGVSYFDIGPREDMGYGLALQTDDKVVVCGTSVDTASVEYNNVPVVVRFNSDGTVDNAFGTNGVARIPVTFAENDFSVVRIQPDGKIVAAGHIANGLLWFSALIARFNTDGTLDNTFGTNGVVNKNVNNVDDEFFDMQLTTDNNILLTGFTTTQGNLYYHTLVMKYDFNGDSVASFGNNGKVVLGTEPMNVGDALTIQPDGKLIIVGASGMAPPDNQDWGLWRLNADGSPDNGFGYNGRITLDFAGAADEALGVALQSDGKIVVAGKSRNPLPDFAIARYDDKLLYTSVDELSNNNALSIFPNPATNNLYLQGITQKTTVFVYDMVGHVVLSQQVTADNATLDVAGLANGMYLIQTGNSQNKTLKFVKQ